MAYKYKIYLLSLIVVGTHEGIEDIHGDREDDGAVVLRRDAVEGLQVSQLDKEGVITCRDHSTPYLESRGIVHDNLSCMSVGQVSKCM